MITFVCKDPVIAQHCQNQFGERFGRLLAKAGPDNRDGAVLRMLDVLMAEARIQEWYDYVEDTDEHGARVRVLLTPRELLIPKVLITDA